MLVPRFWAQGRIQRRENNRQVTVKRWGWSNDSAEDAQRVADERTQVAFDRIVQGESSAKALPRMEPKVAYNGADGVPIREEILKEYGDDFVITRNSYGAHCLNVSDVVFADVDCVDQGSPRLRMLVYLLGLVSVFVGWYAVEGGVAGLIVSLGSLMVACEIIIAVGHRVLLSLAGGLQHMALTKIRQSFENRTDWLAHVYKTPHGYRVLLMHQVFSPNDPAVLAWFKEVGVDPVYQRMCRLQQCFRARLTAKPWRIGISEHMKPRRAVWPLNDEQMQVRIAWTARYDEECQVASSCRFIETLGNGIIHQRCRLVCEVHDAESRAHVMDTILA